MSRTIFQNCGDAVICCISVIFLPAYCKNPVNFTKSSPAFCFLPRQPVPLVFAGDAHALSRRSLAKTDAPLHPPRPRSGIGTGVVVCRVCWWRVMCRKSSPAAAFSGDSRDLICATLATSGEVSPDPSRRRATLAGFSAILQKSGNFSKIIARFLLF